MFRISNNNRGSSLVPKPTSGLDQQTQSYMDSLEQIIRVPLQELTLEQINQDPEGFNTNCSGAKEYLGQLRLEAKDTKESKNIQGRVDPQPSPVCKHLLGVLKVFVEESLVEILNKWETLLSSGSMKFDEASPFLQVTLIGLEIMRSAVVILQGALGKKQKVWDEMTKLSSVFRSLNEIVITKPSLILLGESQMVCGDADQSELMQLLDRIYKAIWGITFMLKKQNLLADLSDNLLNTMEIAFIEMIDSDQMAQNILGYEILTNMLYLTDNEYYLSLVNVVSNWHKKFAINNIGKLYQILFLAANESTRERILWEVERLEPEELYKFLQVFDSKMYEGYFEGGLLFQDENTIVPKPSLLIEKMGLTQKLVTKLQEIMNKKVCDDLLKTTQSLKNKNSPLYQQNQKRFISLMKIASVSVNSSLFFYGPTSLSKLHESLLQIIEDILTNSAPNEIHYVQLQGIIDVFHGMFKGMNPDQFEMIVDTISKSENIACEMFAAKFGSILPHMNYDTVPQDRILAKLGVLYNKMIQSDDALSKCKAVEGIMLAANHATVDDISVIIPPEDEGKALLRKVGNPGQEDDQKMTKEIADEMLGTLGGRLAAVLEKHKISMEKFANIQRDFGFDIGSNGLGRDDDLEQAFKKIEEMILKLKEAETQPQNEYKKLQLRNKVNSLLDMCDPSTV